MVDSQVADKATRGGSKPYFEPESRVQLVDKLHHYARFSDFLLVLTGAEGSGKSTLLKQLAASVPDSTVLACTVAGRAELTPGNLLDALLAQVPDHSAHPATDQGMLQAISEQIRAFRAQGQRLLIILDDADQVSDSVLDLLINLHCAGDNDDGTAPQVVLAGKPELAARLQQGGWIEALAGRYHALELPPFGPEETLEFIRQYFPQAAARGDKPLQRLAQQSAGLPGQVIANLQPASGKRAAKSISAAGAQSGDTAPVKRRAFPLPPIHMVGVVLLLIMITVVAAWQFSPDEAPVVTVDAGEDRIAVPLAIEVGGGEPSPTNRALQARLAEQEARLQISPEPAVNESAPVEPVSTEVVATAPDNEPPNLPAEPLAEESPVTPVAAAEPEPQAVVATAPAPKPAPEPEPVVVSTESQPEPKVITSTPTVPVSMPEPKVDAATVVVEQRSQPVTAVAEANDSRLPKNARLRADEQALLELPANGYALQVLGARELKSIDRFFRDYPDERNLKAFSSIFKGRPWYVVVYGHYPSRDAASAGIAELPEALRKQRPWARSIKGIQNDIRNKQ